MAKKGLKRKQKAEVVKKEDESKVILPLVRRSDEPVTKKVWFFDFQIKFYFNYWNSIRTRADLYVHSCFIHTLNIEFSQNNFQRSSCLLVFLTMYDITNLSSVVPILCSKLATINNRVNFTHHQIWSLKYYLCFHIGFLRC